MLEYFVFFFFAAVAVLFALVVILHRNPVVGALSLVVSFFALAVMYVLLDAAFLAALQVIIYAGAIMVLFLFVIMLLNLQRMEEPPTRPVQQFLGYTASGAFLIGLVYYIGKYTLFTRRPPGPFRADARTIGVRLFEAYILPFEMVSILLLAAIVGALLLSGRTTGQRTSAGTEAGPRPVTGPAADAKPEVAQ
ncbi:MAG TPA: NADH-quinone oxidoreductase subunit J [Thermoanaerobaculia bacterium]|nr:NADH-quinone oxidoreductase subunit J [Thermoanaerobaculia bacterium]